MCQRLGLICKDGAGCSARLLNGFLQRVGKTDRAAGREGSGPLQQIGERADLFAEKIPPPALFDHLAER